MSSGPVLTILFATNQLEVGGIETNLVRLTERLVARGHRVVAVTRGGRLVSSFEAAGGIHHAVEFSARPSQMRRCIIQLAEVIETERPDVLHSFSASTAPIAWLARKRSRLTERCLLITSVMGLKNSPKEPAVVTYLRAFFVTVGADKIAVIAPAIEKVLRRLPIARSRLLHMPLVGVQVPEGVDKAAARLMLHQQLEVPTEGPLVMTMGNLEPRKSHDLFIRAAREVLTEFPAASFVIVGTGALEDRLQQMIVDAGLGSRARLVGERTDGPALLAAADVYVRPGVVEGFVGITVLEAQAAGVPVVSFETEDVKLAIDHGRTGVLVPNGDVAALAAAIGSLLKDPARANSIATQGREHVRRTFSIDVVTEGVESMYRREIASARGFSGGGGGGDRPS